jgi:beta-lactam-binding protein with PASTA domain
LGKLVFVGVLLFAFLAGMAGVVYMALSGNEVQVPDLVGKDFVESEKELASLGLKLKRRADRPSSEKINTVLEQLPKPGETVKTGQMILVVVSKMGAEGEVAPPTLKKSTEEDDAEKIEEMISDKPKTNSNTAKKKKADTKRDVIANTSTSDSNDAKPADEDKKEPAEKKDDSGKDEKNDKKEPAPKPQNTPGPTRLNVGKPLSNEPRSRPM